MKPFMEKPFDQSKRRLLQGSVVLASGALGAALPIGAGALASSDIGARKAVYKAPLFDPTLENYPGYSTYVPVMHRVDDEYASSSISETLSFPRIRESSAFT